MDLFRSRFARFEFDGQRFAFVWRSVKQLVGRGGITQETSGRPLHLGFGRPVLGDEKLQFGHISRWVRGIFSIELFQPSLERVFW